MKRLTLFLPLIFVGFLSPHISMAQRSVTFGVEASHGGKAFKPHTRRGLGGSLGFEKQLFDAGSLTVLVAYDWFDRRWPSDIDETLKQDSMAGLGLLGKDISFLPIRLGYRQYFFDNGFANVEAGFSRLFSAYDKVNRKYCFTYSVGAGYKILLKEKNIIEVSVNYNYNRVYRFLNLNYWSFRAAYGITRLK